MVEQEIAEELHQAVSIWDTTHTTQLWVLIRILYDRRFSFEVDRVWDGLTDVTIRLSESAQPICFRFDRGESIIDWG